MYLMIFYTLYATFTCREKGEKLHTEGTVAAVLTALE